MRRVSDRLEFVNRSCGQKKCKQYNPEMNVTKILSGETQRADSLDKTPTVSADYSMHHSTLICTIQNVYTVQTPNFVLSSGQSVIQCAIVYSERCCTVYAVYAVPLAVCSLCRIAVDISQ